MAGVRTKKFTEVERIVCLRKKKGGERVMGEDSIHCHVTETDA